MPQYTLPPNNGLANLYGGAVMIWAAVFVVISVIIHVCFAIGVNRDAARREQHAQDTVFVGRLCWTFATLLGGPFMAGLYWVMHRSTLAPAPESPLRVICPICDTTQQFAPSAAGTVRECQTCRRPIHIPEADEPADGDGARRSSDSGEP
jgi:hypothetical protein